MTAELVSNRLGVTLPDVYAARERLRGVINATPLQTSRTLAARVGSTVWLKPECLQRTGSFKLRGAYNKIAGLSAAERARGVITYSSGNHAQGVACAAGLLGIRAVVVMPEDAIPAKVAATRGYGAEVVFAGLDSLQRQARALELQEEFGYTVVPPFDDAAIIAGQATVGLEIVEELPDVATVIVPCGGSGLLSGIALAVRELRPAAQVIGIEPATAADAQASLAAGHVVEAESVDTICDGLRTRRIGDLNFRFLQRYVSRIETVPDAASLEAMRFLALRCKLVVEPSGAVAVAALLRGLQPAVDGPVVAVLSGGNADAALLARALADA
ncbi:MAG TPA: threonine/serine dehydratase [Chloroflexota bacterium]|nr:threonine/serine dehydratase [Chloroflexota bacterium]